MLASLEKYFCKRYNYPIVIFTEEDLPVSVQQSIVASMSVQVRFKRIQFAVPAFLNKSQIPERTVCSPQSSTIGYRHMCRFMANRVHEELSRMGYSWHWRLDDDSLLTSDIGYDVFRMMKQNNKVYGFVNTVMDGPSCVKGLWENADKFLKANGQKLNISTSFYDGWPRGQVFYNNFEISHASVWTSQIYQSYFEQVDRAGGIYYTRWGDAAIKSIGIALSVEESKVHRFSDWVHPRSVCKPTSRSEKPLNTTFCDHWPARLVADRALDIQSRFNQDSLRQQWFGGDCSTSFPAPKRDLFGFLATLL